MNRAEKIVHRIDGTVRALRATGEPIDEARHDALMLEFREISEELEDAIGTAQGLPPNELAEFNSLIRDVQRNMADLIREFEERRRGERP